MVRVSLVVDLKGRFVLDHVLLEILTITRLLGVDTQCAVHGAMIFCRPDSSFDNLMSQYHEQNR